MLDFIRRNTQSWFVKLFLGLVIGSFAVWGIGDISRSRLSDPVIATIGEYDIHQSEVLNVIQRQFKQLKIQDPEQLKAIARQFAPMVIDGLVTEYMLVDLVKDTNLYIPDQVIKEEVYKNIRGFQINGVFNKGLLEQYLARENLTEDKFVEELRKDLAKQFVVRLIAKKTVVPEFVLEKFYKYEFEKREADFYELQAAKIPAPEPQPDELKAYYLKNQSKYMLPEYRNLSVLALSASNKEIRSKITDDEAKAHFEANKESFMAIEKRKLTHLTVSSPEQAQTVYDFLKNGGNIQNVKTELPELEINVADMNWVQKQDLIGNIADQVFALTKAGEVTKPVETFGKWQIYYIQDAQIAKTPLFGDVKEKVIDELAAALVVELANQMDELLLDEETLENISNDIGVSVFTVEQMPDYGFPVEEAANHPAIVGKDEFLNASFELREGKTSLLQETPDGSYFVVRADQVNPAKAKDFDFVKDIVQVDWEFQKRFDIAQEKMQAIYDKLRNKEATIEELVAQEGLIKVAAPVFSRTGAEIESPLIPKTLPSSLFTQTVGAPLYEKSSQGYVLAILKNILPADMDLYDLTKDKTLQTIANELDVDIRNRLGIEKKKQMGIQVHAENIETIIP